MQLPEIKERKLYLYENVNSESIKTLSEKVFQINDSDSEITQLSSVLGFQYKPKPIQLFINSDGGCVDTTFGFTDIIKLSSTPVYTIVTGKAFSAGLLILMSGHKRFAHKNSNLMLHQSSSWTDGKYQDIVEYVEEYKLEEQKLKDYILENSSISYAKLEEVYTHKKDLYITPEDALMLDIIDEIL